MSHAVAVSFYGLPQIIEKFDINDTALSDESIEIHQKFKRSADHYLEPVSRLVVDQSTKFNKLKSQWEEETVTISSVTEIVIHPTYQKIIGMGPTAIPLILSEMKRKPGHWFWALKSITDEDPILPEQRGKIIDMTQAWLDWGRSKGYIND